MPISDDEPMPDDRRLEDDGRYDPAIELWAGENDDEIALLRAFQALSPDHRVALLYIAQRGDRAIDLLLQPFTEKEGPPSAETALDAG